MSTNKPLEIKPAFTTRLVIGCRNTLLGMSIACFAAALFSESGDWNIRFFTWIGCALVLILILAAILYSFRYSWVDMAKADREKEIKILHNRIAELEKVLDKKESEDVKNVQEETTKAPEKNKS